MTTEIGSSEKLDPGKFEFSGLHSNILEGIKWRKKMNLIINNRAGGNAPMIARLIAGKFLEIYSKEI